MFKNKKKMIVLVVLIIVLVLSFSSTAFAAYRDYDRNCQYFIFSTNTLNATNCNTFADSNTSCYYNGLSDTDYQSRLYTTNTNYIAYHSSYVISQSSGQIHTAGIHTQDPSVYCKFGNTHSPYRMYVTGRWYAY